MSELEQYGTSVTTWPVAIHFPLPNLKNRAKFPQAQIAQELGVSEYSLTLWKRDYLGQVKLAQIDGVA